MQAQGGKSAANASVKQFYKPGRRPRATLSCDACRTRKYVSRCDFRPLWFNHSLIQAYRLKCNREQPCQNCTTRGEQSTCKWRGSKNTGPATTAVDPMQQRIDRLESLVKRLMSRNEQSTPPEDNSYPENQINSEYVSELVANGNDDSAWPVSTGMTVIDGSRSVYKASDNWGDVLQEVRNKFSIPFYSVFALIGRN
jgi:hypothetical protein